MADRDQARERATLQRELIELRNRHRDALQQDTYVGLTASERQEYGERLHRIAELEHALNKGILNPSL